MEIRLSGKEAKQSMRETVTRPAKETTKKMRSPFFPAVLWLIRLFYLKMEVVGLENLPDEPVILVGNHTQMHGPIACELKFPEKRYTWCAGEMMHLKEVPAYTYRDFWSQKSRWTRWFFRIASYLIAPLSVYIFNNANTIEVYRDARILSTMRESMKRLDEGANIVIFPEQDVKYNHILYQFQEGFVDLARLYHRKSGRSLCFVPLYIAPGLKQMILGKPIRYCPEHDPAAEKKRIIQYLMDEITRTACALPRHRVVPYRNIPKRNYPYNRSDEVSKA